LKKFLFIVGTGLISSACSELALSLGNELFILNRSISKKHPLPEGAVLLNGDIKADVGRISKLLSGLHFDAVVDFIAFTAEDVERDLALFSGKTDQFVFISSASAYQKPPQNYLITEETTLENPFWQYSRDKIDCEERLMKAFREDGFPITIIRPSLTYGLSQIPFCFGSWQHPWTVIDRIKKGKKIIVPGDGTSLWVLTWNADFARGLIGLMGYQKAIGEVFHITSDEVLTWDQIYREAFTALGVAPMIVHIPTELISAYWPHAVGSLQGDKANSVVFDNSKIKKFVPDFKCEVNWAEGLHRSIAWFEAHPQFQTIDREMEALFDTLLVAYEKAYPS
jgi:nucleoside-diphosphate-sugar epimerase